MIPDGGTKLSKIDKGTDIVESLWNSYSRLSKAISPVNLSTYGEPRGFVATPTAPVTPVKKVPAPSLGMEMKEAKAPKVTTQIPREMLLLGGLALLLFFFWK